jgi:hypothetical protein
MGGQIHLATHLSIADLEQRYRASYEPHERSGGNSCGCWPAARRRPPLSTASGTRALDGNLSASTYRRPSTSICSSCRPTRPNCSPPSACGRSPTLRWSTSALPPSRTSKTPNSSASQRSNNGPISSAQRRVSTGGPHASPNVEGQGAIDIMQRFVPPHSLRLINAYGRAKLPS